MEPRSLFQKPRDTMGNHPRHGRANVSSGVAVAVGAALGAAYGASAKELAIWVAYGAAVGALLDFLVHAVRLVQRKRARSDQQSQALVFWSEALEDSAVPVSVFGHAGVPEGSAPSVCAAGES